MAKPETDAERKKREEEEKKKAEKPEEEEDEEEMKKVDDRTVKDLTSASEMLVSLAGKAKDGTSPDPKAIGKVIDVLMGVKEKYPSPRSKSTKKMSATEFVDWARDELKKAADEEEPKTRVARLARVQDQMKKAQEAFDSGEEQVEVQVGEVHEFSPFASDQMPANGFAALGDRLDALDKKVDALGKSSDGEPDPDVDGRGGWPLDMAPDPGASDDPALSWGRRSSAGKKKETWGPDGQ